MDRPPLRLGAVVWDWSRPYLLGVVNVTPDSFSDHGAHASLAAAVDHALALLDQGADALDVGGESTRPGATAVSEADEIARVVPVVEAIARRTGLPVSIDTTKASVARRALEAGAVIVNDVGMGDCPLAMATVAAAAGAAYIAMHSLGTPATMAALARYENVGREVASALLAFVRAVEAAGVPPGRVMVDPGIGFAKTANQSLRLLADLAPIRALGYPVCVGPSRKSFIAAQDAYGPAWGSFAAPPSERTGGTAAAVTAAVLQGVEVLRVHDVAVMRQVARVAHGLRTRLHA